MLLGFERNVLLSDSWRQLIFIKEINSVLLQPIDCPYLIEFSVRQSCPALLLARASMQNVDFAMSDDVIVRRREAEKLLQIH